MARKAINNNGNTINRPYRFKLTLQNNGEARVYDRTEKKAVENLKLEGFTYLARTYFLYNLAIKKGERVTDIVTTEYNRKSQAVTIVDKIENTRQKAEAGEAKAIIDGNTGIVIYALRGNEVYQIEGSSSVLGQFMDFQSECSKNGVMPDFSIKSEENKTGEGPRYNWQFSGHDIEPEAADLQNAAKALIDYFKGRGLETNELDPLTEGPETTGTEEDPETPAFQ